MGRIVFTSGVFDILHAGHIDFFKKAKKFAGENGILIVATHDDKSISRVKGKNRPVNSAEDRVKVLNAIRYIDEVVLWKGWENIQELVKLIKPDYIACAGNEYKQKGIEKFCKENGIKLKTFSRTKPLSTTKLLEKLDF